MWRTKRSLFNQTDVLCFSDNAMNFGCFQGFFLGHWRENAWDPLSNHCLTRTRRSDQQDIVTRSEEHTSELQSRPHLVCRLLLEKKKTISNNITSSLTPLSNT